MTLLDEHPRIVNNLLGPVTVHYREVLLYMYVLPVVIRSHNLPDLGFMSGLTQVLKRGCIEFKYYADGIRSGLTPPGNNS